MKKGLILFQDGVRFVLNWLENETKKRAIAVLEKASGSAKFWNDIQNPLNSDICMENYLSEEQFAFYADTLLLDKTNPLQYPEWTPTR